MFSPGASRDSRRTGLAPVLREFVRAATLNMHETRAPEASQRSALHLCGREDGGTHKKAKPIRSARHPCSDSHKTRLKKDRFRGTRNLHVLDALAGDGRLGARGAVLFHKRHHGLDLCGVAVYRETAAEFALDGIEPLHERAAVGVGA